MGAFTHHEAHEACGSSDALARYENGTGYCWSCNTWVPAEGGECDVSDDGGNRQRKVLVATPPSTGPGPMLKGEARALSKRRISKEICKKYGYLQGVDERGRPCQIATYYDSKGQPVAQKLRYPDKSAGMPWRGDKKATQLFGQHLWAGGRRLVVTEGEIDALSVAEVQNGRYAVVSIPDGAASARKALAKQLSFLDQFEKVILMFDMDDPGRAAAAECAELIPGKACIAQLPRKDASECLMHGEFQAIRQAVFEAKPYQPADVVLGEDLWEAVSQPLEKGLPYPWPCFFGKTYGLRPRELVTFCAGTGIGKSQFVKEIMFNLARMGETVGILSLEESVRHAALCQMSLSADLPLHLPDTRASVSEETLRSAFDATLATGRYRFLDHFGSMDAEQLIPKIRYMVLGLGCKWIALDHVSIVISGTATDGDERKRIDELMTKLRQTVEELEVGMLVVSHLRKASGTPHEEGGRVTLADLRGSGAIAQVSNLVFGLERDQQAGDGEHETTVRLLKNRFSGETGSLGVLSYNPKTGRIVEKDGLTPVSATPSSSPNNGKDDF